MFQKLPEFRKTFPQTSKNWKRMGSMRYEAKLASCIRGMDLIPPVPFEVWTRFLFLYLTEHQQIQNWYIGMWWLNSGNNQVCTSRYQVKEGVTPHHRTILRYYRSYYYLARIRGNCSTIFSFATVREPNNRGVYTSWQLLENFYF